MSLYIQIVDKDDFKSPILYIHCDEDEFLAQIEIWKDGLIKEVEDGTLQDAWPLGRLDATTCLCDLMRHLTEYYVETTLPEHNKGRIKSTFRLHNENEIVPYEDPVIFNTGEWL